MINQSPPTTSTVVSPLSCFVLPDPGDDPSTTPATTAPTTTPPTTSSLTTASSSSTMAATTAIDNPNYSLNDALSTQRLTSVSPNGAPTGASGVTASPQNSTTHHATPLHATPLHGGSQPPSEYSTPMTHFSKGNSPGLHSYPSPPAGHAPPAPVTTVSTTSTTTTPTPAPVPTYQYSPPYPAGNQHPRAYHSPPHAGSTTLAPVVTPNALNESYADANSTFDPVVTSYTVTTPGEAFRRLSAEHKQQQQQQHHNEFVFNYPL